MSHPVFQRDEHLIWSLMAYGDHVLHPVWPHQIIMPSKNIKPTRAVLGMKINCLLLSEFLESQHFWGICGVCFLWGLTYIVAGGGFSRRQGAGAEDRGAGWTAELRERVWDGWERWRPQLLFFLLQPPRRRRQDKGAVIGQTYSVLFIFYLYHLFANDGGTRVTCSLRLWHGTASSQVKWKNFEVRAADTCDVCLEESERES